ncbi:MAG: succinate dehydrogenase assembly factor 2 [Pseudomonadota bacterium]
MTDLSTANADDSAHLRALTWRCRRGMRELDQLLVGYLQDHYPGADAGLQHQFERLLELQDPVIFGYLVRGEQPEDAGIRDIVRAVLGAAETVTVRT